MGRTRWVRQTFLLLLLAIILWVVGWAFWQYHGPAAEQQIFHGIYYGCERLPDTAEGRGLVHWVRADLNVAGVKLYVTPTDIEAQAHGSEYKLRYVSTTVTDEKLAAAINGTMFASNSTLIRLPGDFARSVETVVCNHRVDHFFYHTYLLWWDDDLLAHFAGTKPPSADALKNAKWGMGSQQPILLPNWMLRPDPNLQLKPSPAFLDRRTVIAANPEKKLVWIVCFDSATFGVAAEWSANHGATMAAMFDGGTSTAMAIGDGAVNVRPGTVTGNWRPVATQFGFFAEPLR